MIIMLDRNPLLDLIHCCFGPCYEPTLSFYDLYVLGLGSIVIISLLLLYYNKIPKTNTNNLPETLIYQSKDILLQEKSADGVYLTQEKTLSIWAKLTIYLLVIIAITTPLYQLFGIGHFI